MKKEDKIVDIGTGFGKSCFELLSNAYKSVVGFDINQEGINFANRKLSELPKNIQARCSFQVQDALNTNFDPNSFDHGIMQAFLTTLTTPEHRQNALEEARRIIKPTGGLYLAVFIQTWFINKYRIKYEIGEEETNERGSFNVYNKETGEVEYMAHHYSERELSYLLKKTGFKIEEYTYEKFTTRSGNIVNGCVIYAK